MISPAENDEAEGFRDRLRELTVDAGGIKEFAKKAGISYPAARNYLAKSEPSRAVLMKIILSFGLSPNFFSSARAESAAADAEAIATLAPTARSA